METPVTVIHVARLKDGDDKKRRWVAYAHTPYIQFWTAEARTRLGAIGGLVEQLLTAGQPIANSVRVETWNRRQPARSGK